MDSIQSIYENIWWELMNMGYDEGDDITYYDFVDACDEAGTDSDDIDIDDFSEIFKVNIG